MVQIIWSKQALEDLKEIFDYISLDSKEYAKLQVVRIKIKTNTLKSHNKIGRVVPEFGIPEIREVMEGNYRIIYSLESNQSISILTIHHGARDLKARSL